MKKIIKGIAPFLLAAVLAIFLTACTDLSGLGNNPSGSDGDAPVQTTLSTATTKSVVPGNFNIYDYYKDVYGFSKDTAYTANYKDQENKPFFFSTRTNTTVNDTSVTFGQYHPYSTLSYEEFFYLLNSERAEDLGYYAVVFGGEWEENISEALYTVRDAAAEVVTTKTPTTNFNYTRYTQSYLPVVYNFDFKISGGLKIEERLAEFGLVPADEYNTDIREDQTEYNSGKNTVTKLYKDLYNKLDTKGKFDGFKDVTGKESSVEFTPVKYIASPSIVLIKKYQNTDGTLVNSVEDYVDLSSDAASKKEDVKTLLNKASATTDNAGNNIPAGFRSFNYFTYIWGSYTQGSSTSLTYAYTDALPTGSFTNSFTNEKLIVQYDNLTDKNHVYRTVSYAELIHLLQTEGNFLIYFGGSWCHYSRGFLAPLNEFAKTYYVNEIYVFDPYIDGTSSATNIRNSEGSGFFTRLYANLLTYFGAQDYHSYSFPSEHDYLTSFLLQEKAAGNLLSGSVINSDLKIGEQYFDRIGVPTLIGYRKGNVDANGVPMPVFGTANTQLAFEEIVAAAEEPTKGGTEITEQIENAREGVKYYEHANYLSVARTSTSGRIVEYNVISFFKNFYDGKSTYDVVSAPATDTAQ